MAISRRSILAAFAAAGVAPKPVLGAADIMGAAAAANLPSGEAMESVAVGRRSHNLWDLSSKVGPMRNGRVHEYLHYSPHITTKRSWSQAFKMHVASQEEQQARALAELIEGMTETEEKAFRLALGILN